MATDCVSGENGEEIGDVGGDCRGGCDGAEGYHGTDYSCGYDDGHGEDEESGVDRHVVILGQLAEVFGPWQDAVTGDGVGDALG